MLFAVSQNHVHVLVVSHEGSDKLPLVISRHLHAVVDELGNLVAFSWRLNQGRDVSIQSKKGD